MARDLRSLRLARGLKQKTLAEQANVSASALSRWEYGKQIPSIEESARLARVLHVTLDQLLVAIQASRELHGQSDSAEPSVSVYPASPALAFGI